MSQPHERIFLGTVLLERNRWSKENRKPSFLVSDWTQRIADDGFDGLELWEDHALLADEDERERLRTGPAPVSLLNSYAGCEREDSLARQHTAELATFFDAEGMKFNFGKVPDRLESYIEVVREWSRMFKPGYRMLSENHRGTVTADPELAAHAYARLQGANIGGILHFGSDEETYRTRFGCYGKYITHIHCALSSEDGPMAEDDIRQRVSWLRSFGFSGTYAIEFTEGVRSELPIEGLYRNAVRDFRTLRRCLAAE